MVFANIEWGFAAIRVDRAQSNDWLCSVQTEMQVRAAQSREQHDSA